jgi:hypothetical protein
MGQEKCGMIPVNWHKLFKIEEEGNEENFEKELN